MQKRTEKNKTPLDEVFAPRGVAVVGASARNLGFAELVIDACKRAEFPAIYPVNPKYEEVLDLPCYPSVVAIPGPVDHVVVNIPAEASLKLLDDCAAKGVKSVHFFTAGFSESGVRENADLEQEMLEKAKAGGFRIIGPNCVGLYLPKSRLHNDPQAPLDSGPVAFISQSGGHSHGLPYVGKGRGLRFSKVVSFGNGLDVDACELMAYFAEDDETDIIAAYLEGVPDGDRFQKILSDASGRKPVVIYKAGRTEAGKRAAHGHTASMSSSMTIFDAVCRQSNAISADNVDELADVLVALRFANPIPRGTGVALIGAGGGPSVLAGDEMEKEGLCLPHFTPDVQDALKQVLPVAGSIFNNPLDTPNMTTPEAIPLALDILSRVPTIDMLVYHIGFHPIGRWGLGRFTREALLDPMIGAIKEVVQSSGKPVLLALRPPPDMDGMNEFLTAQETFASAGIPVFYSLKNLARAMARVIAWNQVRNKPGASR